MERENERVGPISEKMEEAERESESASKETGTSKFTDNIL